jgi:hypothetical protein
MMTSPFKHFNIFFVENWTAMWCNNVFLLIIGKNTETTYFGEHERPKQPCNIKSDPQNKHHSKKKQHDKHNTRQCHTFIVFGPIIYIYKLPV